MTASLHIGVVAGEASGDILGAALLARLRERFPEARFTGVGGPQMIEAGLESLYDMERLSVMGFVEPLKRLPELLSMRRKLVKHFRRSRVDLFIGIDSPDFNLGIAKRLHNRGIRTAHYVSPSVWAWRQGRVKGIRESVDLMLTLFPFEARFYEEEGVPVTFVGHPLAEQLQHLQAREAARQELGLPAEAPVVAIMPGSRQGEVNLMLPPFIEAARKVRQAKPEAHFLIPAANGRLFESISRDVDLEKCHILPGQSRQVVAAADVVLLASGTSTLEVMLQERPMVVAYRLGGLTYAIARHLVKTPYISIPNLLARKPLVPEFIQDEVKPKELARQIMKLLIDPAAGAQQTATFAGLKDTLSGDSAGRAASAIAELLEGG